jgi:glycosyltransferase involved in cell wall biosynthesis
MKIYAEVIAYNEEAMIGESLGSIYDHVDEVVVVDGSQWGPSTDRTAEIAKSLGPKVSVLSGTFKDNGWDHLWVQRKFGVGKMDKGYDNWCISHDADEVFEKDSIGRLTGWLRDNKYPDTWLISYPHINFWVDRNHVSRGGTRDKVRGVGSFRLMPGVTWLNYHRVGMEEDGRSFEGLSIPRRIIRKNIRYYHYGYATTIEKYMSKSRFYFLRDSSFRGGYKADEWEKFWAEVELPKWEHRLEARDVYNYEGPWI